MVALGIDLGNKHCGIALEVNNISIPKEIVRRHLLIKSIGEYIKSYNVDEIVVGLPYDLYNKEHTQLEKTQKFIKKLQSIFPDILVVGVDERFTTYDAQMSESQLGGKKYERKRDDISAQIILDSYLGMKK